MQNQRKRELLSALQFRTALIVKGRAMSFVTHILLVCYAC